MDIDIVNDRDEVIGKKERDLVHRDGDWHRIAHIWVFNSKGKILCHKRSDSKKMFPGLWDTILGGHLDSGETYENSAKRELKEEVGIDSQDLIELGKWKGIANTTQTKNKEIIKYFAFRFDGNIDDLKFNEDEISELKFISLKELKEISKDNEKRKMFVSFVYFDEIYPKLEKMI